MKVWVAQGDLSPWKDAEYDSYHVVHALKVPHFSPTLAAAKSQQHPPQGLQRPILVEDRASPIGAVHVIL